MTAIDTSPVPLAGIDQLLNRAEHLIWSLLDDNLPEEGVVELETILRDCPNGCEVFGIQMGYRTILVLSG